MPSQPRWRSWRSRSRGLGVLVAPELSVQGLCPSWHFSLLCSWSRPRGTGRGEEREEPSAHSQGWVSQGCWLEAVFSSAGAGSLVGSFENPDLGLF